jgi:hypothetical protein
MRNDVKILILPWLHGRVYWRMPRYAEKLTCVACMPKSNTTTTYLKLIEELLSGDEDIQVKGSES